jgi:hypothetical protein
MIPEKLSFLQKKFPDGAAVLRLMARFPSHVELNKQEKSTQRKLRDCGRSVRGESPYEMRGTMGLRFEISPYTEKIGLEF